MFIDFKRHKRNDLTQDQKEFLHVLVPFSKVVQEQCKTKARLSGIGDTNGIYSSIICAEAIIRSNWNTNKISEKYNNLMMLEVDEFYWSKGKEYNGKRYKFYDSWLDFAIDLSDYYVFSGLYSEALNEKSLDKQVDIISLINAPSSDFCGKIESLIESLGLWEFDL